MDIVTVEELADLSNEEIKDKLLRYSYRISIR